MPCASKPRTRFCCAMRDYSGTPSAPQYRRKFERFWRQDVIFLPDNAIESDCKIPGLGTDGFLLGERSGGKHCYATAGARVPHRLVDNCIDVSFTRESRERLTISMVSFVQKMGFVIGKRRATHIDRAALYCDLEERLRQGIDRS